MSRFTFQTEGGNKIDVVHNREEVENIYFIMYDRLPELLERCKELGIKSGGVTKKVFKLLRFEKLIRKRKIVND